MVILSVSRISVKGFWQKSTKVVYAVGIFFQLIKPFCDGKIILVIFVMKFIKSAVSTVEKLSDFSAYCILLCTEISGVLIAAACYAARVNPWLPVSEILTCGVRLLFLSAMTCLVIDLALKRCGIDT